MLMVYQSYLIKKYRKNINKSYRQKLIAMGMIPGETFTVRGIAPLGDPILIEVHGYSLGLRQKELDFIEVEALDGRN